MYLYMCLCRMPTITDLRYVMRVLVRQSQHAKYNNNNNDKKKKRFAALNKSDSRLWITRIENAYALARPNDNHNRNREIYFIVFFSVIRGLCV